MTVTRVRRIHVDRRGDLAQHLEGCLSRDPRFHDLYRTPSGYRFHYRHRLWPLVLSTQVDVTMLQTPDHGVEVLTTSQRAILADAFQMYEGILDCVEAAITHCSE